jgi:Serine aminopeptidase, S33
MSASLFKLLKKPFFGRFMVKWQNPLSLDQQKEWQQLRVKSKSGGLIYGLFAKATTQKIKATIVLGHPMGKEAKAYFLKQGYTDLLRRNGYNTLLFDINGFGESTHGNFDYFEDIVAIGIEAAKLSPGLPIGYHGISLGGQWATVAFADKTHKYDFAIIESAATSLDAFWINFPTAYKVLQALNFCLPKFREKVDMKERIKEAKRLSSLLLIYSCSDEWTPVAMGKIFLDNSPVATELWTVESADHAAIMKSGHRNEYEEKIIDYFNKNATPNSDTPPNYKIAESSPLSDEEILKIKKDINTHYSVNILLIPLLIIIYFWGFLFFFHYCPTKV